MHLAGQQIELRLVEGAHAGKDLQRSRMVTMGCMARCSVRGDVVEMLRGAAPDLFLLAGRQAARCSASLAAIQPA
jgi:hypothetical protein